MKDMVCIQKTICYIIGHRFGGKSNPAFKRKTTVHNIDDGKTTTQVELVCNHCGVSENKLWGSILGVTNDNLWQRTTYLIRYKIQRMLYRLFNE